MMMDDSAPTHERRKLVKTYKIVLPQKQTGPKMIKRWSRKTSTNVKNQLHKLKGNAERERERGYSH